MADKKSELPGFYKDPKTGKYYREKPESIVNPSLKKLKKVREEEASQNESCIKPPKTPNVLEYIRSRELGSLSGLRAEREYFRMRTYKKWFREEISLNDFQPYNIVSVDYIKGSRNSIFGVWNIKENPAFRCVVGERTFIDLPYHSHFGFNACGNYAIDMCEGPDDTVVCLYNHLYSGAGCFAFLPRSADNTDISTSRWSSPLFCCASTNNGTLFAFGCEGSIRFYNRFSCEKTYLVRGRVHSLAFNEASNLMISGLHNGFLCLHDVRQRLQKMEFQVSDYCVTDISFLNPDQVIAAGANNMLKKIDLRTNETVTEYFGHKSSVKKRPFSIVNDMLCASGTDNIIRIWPISGGNPIHEIKPINSPDNETRGWLYGHSNKTYLYQFEQHLTRIYQIT